MKSSELLKRIRRFALASFIVPLIAINGCLLVYKFLANVESYPNFEWGKNEFELSYKDYWSTVYNYKTRTFTNCPKHFFKSYVITHDNEVIEHTGSLNDDLITQLDSDNKIKSYKFERVLTTNKNEEIYLQKNCSKNYPVFYFLLKILKPLETKIIQHHREKDIAFSKVVNPYFYGEVSISRTARNFPTNFIFKPLIIFSALLLFFYWKNNLNLLKELENKKELSNFSKKFFYFGVASCIFLTLHAMFLGLDFESKLFHNLRKLIIISFILFEVLAQFYLTKNLLKFKMNLQKYLKINVLNIKVIFVSSVIIISFISFGILSLGDPSTNFKHILEWNYFAFLLVYYFLSRLLWK